MHAVQQDESGVRLHEQETYGHSRVAILFAERNSPCAAQSMLF